MKIFLGVKKCNCHTSVEACTPMKSVKYMIKSFYKGYDCANLRMYDNNEIEQFIITKHLEPPGSMWGLNEFKMQNKSHNVIRSLVHLSREQLLLMKRMLK